MSFSEHITGDFDQALDAFADKVKGLAYVGAQAMAQVVYESAKVNVPVKSGKLKDSIYQVKSKDNSNETQATYHVAWNHKKAPHGHLVEFGTVRSAAHPFLYQAFSENKSRLVSVCTDAMKEKMDALK